MSTSLWPLSSHRSVDVGVGTPAPSSRSLTRSNLRLNLNLFHETFHRASLSEPMLCLTHFITYSLSQPAFLFYLLCIIYLSQLKSYLKIETRPYIYSTSLENPKGTTNQPEEYSWKENKKAKWITDSVTVQKQNSLLVSRQSFLVVIDKHRDRITEYFIGLWSESSDHPVVSSAASLIKHQEDALLQPPRAGLCESTDDGFVPESIHLPTQ